MKAVRDAEQQIDDWPFRAALRCPQHGDLFAVRPVGTLHLTLGVMSFPKNEGLEKAIALLKTIIPRELLADALGSPLTKGAERGAPPGPLTPPLSVTLKSLHTMQSAAKASVLYAPPLDTDGVLNKFCERLRSTFQEAGLMVEDDRPLLLHATILNTIYVKGRDSSRGGKGKRREKLTIDARQILDRYNDYPWMEDVPIEKIAICKMGAKKQDNGDEAYEVEAEIDIMPSTPQAWATADISGRWKHALFPTVPLNLAVTGPQQPHLLDTMNASEKRKSAPTLFFLGLLAKQQYNRSAPLAPSSFAQHRRRRRGGTQAAKEREKTLQDKIAELKRELAANEAEFTRALDRLSQNESETASYWQAKYSNLNQQFLRVDTEIRVLRTEVDVREAEKLELREDWELLQRELSQRDTEIRTLRSQITGLKQWVSTNTKKSDQTSDEEFGETIAKLRNGLQNWAVSHFRKSSFDLGKADQNIIDDLGQLVPTYEELAVSETKAAFLQSIVSSILVEMVFNVYFVGLPEEQATQFDQIEKYMAHLSSAEVVNEWRAVTLSMLRKECVPKMQQETDAVIQSVMTRVNCVLDNITDAKATDVRDQALRVLVANAINLARLLVAQKALFRVTMPKILPYQRILFEADTMDHIGEEDEDGLASREIRCITFPGIVKTGDENGKHLQYRNVIAKATVLCSPE
ncbi:hypothetical protein NUW58_g4805 [Xylaria curta]|uniref:Uncharacterized protein n=1 Tax=Xylaria curta TaxID=42375 RepID=A0ACC1P642_9PEZI|nr:hypothetical protein NUW58_g4805 [Xylaria curta]